MQQIANVFSLGAIYALLTLGYALITTVLRFLNFAHADVLVLSCYLFALTKSPFLAVLFAVAVNLAVFLVYQKSEKTLTCAIGISILIEYLLMLVFSSQPKVSGVSSPLVLVLGAGVEKGAMWGIVLSLVLAISLFALLKFTRLGLFLRACADNAFSASLVGINRPLMFGVSFAISGLLAGVGAVVYSLSYPFTPFLGASLSIKAFVCATLGGKNSLVGAFLAGFLLSALETAVCVFVGSGWRDILTFLTLTAVILTDKKGW